MFKKSYTRERDLRNKNEELKVRLREMTKKEMCSRENRRDSPEKKRSKKEGVIQEEYMQKRRQSQDEEP